MIRPIRSIQSRMQNLILKYFSYMPYGKKIQKLYNSHYGETCFIIGHGPSLKVEDLETLHKNNIDCFGVNRIYKIFDKTNWRPTYYVSTDPVLIRDNIDIVEKLPVEYKFIPLQNKYYLGIKVKGATYFFRNDNRSVDGEHHYNLDVTKQVNMRGTVTIASIQLAIHMGYRNIFLIGIDHNFDKIINENGETVVDSKVRNYFIEGYDEDVKNEVKHDIGVTTQAYYDMRRFADIYGINIINASRATKLDAFEKIDFDEVMNKVRMHF